jgi:hypothetical protein
MIIRAKNRIITQCAYQAQMTWVLLTSSLNALEFNYALSSSACGYDKMLDPSSLGLATCSAQIHVCLARCQTQNPWVQLHAKSKCIWVWQNARLNIFEFNNVFGFGEISSPMFLGSITRWAQVHMGLASCQTHHR